MWHGSLCLDTVLARVDVGHLLLPAQLSGTHWAMICVIRLLSLIVSDVCLKLGCFQTTSTDSILEVSHTMRYINSLLLRWLVWKVCRGDVGDGMLDVLSADNASSLRRRWRWIVGGAGVEGNVTRWVKAASRLSHTLQREPLSVPRQALPRAAVL